MQPWYRLLGGTLAILAAAAQAEPEPTYVPMHDKGTSTLYVRGSIGGSGEAEFMVDTGASYMALNEVTMEALREAGKARYLRKLSGVMADGRTRSVPVYLVSEIAIGEACVIRDVEVAVLPGNTRNILGLSALRKTAPFVFDLDTPALGLSHCQAGSV